MTYSRAILVWGILLPAVLGLAVVLGVFWVGGQIETERVRRAERHARYVADSLDVDAIRPGAGEFARTLTAAHRLLAEDTHTELGERLRELERASAGKVERTVYRQDAASRSDLAGVFPIGCDVLEIGLEGSYPAVQELFVKMESERPNLILDSLRVRTLAPTSPRLAFEARYLALRSAARGVGAP